MEKLLSEHNLTIWYNKEKLIIKDLTLDLYPNEIIGLIGLNGAGKTTLLNTLAGVHKNYSADIDYTDRSFKMYRYAVFSEDTSFQYYTFNEYLRHVFSAYGKKINQKEVNELVTGFGFNEYQNILIRDLSMGNRHKVFLITGFALRLPLLLLDEPVNGLDFQSTEYLYQRMNDYRQHGTILFSSHILESITLTADRVFVMKKGRFTQELSKEHLNALRNEEEIT